MPKGPIQFRRQEYRISNMATAAGNLGVKTIESLKGGIYYFFEDDEVVIATSTGSAKMKLATAEIIAEELSDMVKEFRADRREGRMPMDTREIQRMLQGDFK